MEAQQIPVSEKPEPTKAEDQPGIIKLSFTVARILAALLPRLTVKSGSKNLHKSRVQKWLAEQLEEFDKARLELIDEHAVKDDKGEKVTLEGNFVLKDQGKFQVAFFELQSEILIILDGSNDTVKKNALEVVRDALASEESSVELTAEESLVYVYIVEAFEKAFPRATK